MPDTLTDVHVISNMALILKEFLVRMNQDFPTASRTYDERLSYESALANWRSKQKKLGTNEPFLPAFVFKRSVLKHSDHGISRRATFCKVLDVDANNQADIYKMVRGELEVQWMYISERMSDLDKYEIAYLADCGLAGNKELKVLMPEIGEFSYHVTYDRELQDKVVEHDGNYFKAVVGVARITGQFLLFDSTAPVISQVVLDIKDFNDQIFLDNLIC